MRIPNPPSPTKLEHITPSLYETLLGCPARAAWSAHGQHDLVASHPLALLGTCFHDVMAAVQKGQISGTADSCAGAARERFDRTAAVIHADAHPLLKLKFRSSERLPFYNLFRERAAALAAEHCRLPEAAAESVEIGLPAEERFTSKDGVIVGRPDLIDIAQSEVVDYKTGLAAGDGSQVSDREARQLNLYAYLAGEAGIKISRGTIVRGNGESATILISQSDAELEAQKARQTLAEYNSIADDKSFSDIARPAPKNCRGCPCIPMCDPFWLASDPTWQEDCGVHVEGTIVALEQATVQATPLVSMQLNAVGGTVGGESIAVEQVPVAWLRADGDREPASGDIVRIVDGRLTSPEDPIVVRADRIMTAVWRVEPNHQTE